MKRLLIGMICWLLAGLHGAGAAIAAEGPDARILIDVSGSMKGTDPDNLRRPALRLLVGLLPTGARAGVWTFAEQTQPFAALGQVNDAWRTQALAKADQIHSRGQFTHIEEAINRASADWRGPAAGSQRHLVLLTDGMVDVSPDRADSARSRERILTEGLPRLRGLGVKIHTVALSEQADHELLRKLSEQSGGWYEQVQSATQLQRVFLRIFEKVGNPDTVPLKDNKFRVDRNIREITLLVFRSSPQEPTRVLMPNGQALGPDSPSPNLKWHKDEGYDLVTIREPMAGDWQVQAQADPDNRVVVLTDLKMEVGAIPDRILLGQPVPVEMGFTDRGERVNQKAFIDRVRVTATQVGPGGTSNPDLELRDDGQGDDSMAYDGRFQLRFTPRGQDGAAQLILSAEAPTFVREKRLLFELQVPAKASLKGGGGTLELLVVPQSGIDLASVQPFAELELADGTRLPLLLEQRPDHSQAAKIDTSGLSGKVQARVRVRANLPDGTVLEAELEPLPIPDLPPTPEAPPVPPQEQPPASPAAPAPEPPPEPKGLLGVHYGWWFGGANVILLLVGGGLWWWLRRRGAKQAILLVDEGEAPATGAS